MPWGLSESRMVDEFRPSSGTSFVRCPERHPPRSHPSCVRRVAFYVFPQHHRHRLTAAELACRLLADAGGRVPWPGPKKHARDKTKQP